MNLFITFLKFRFVSRDLCIADNIRVYWMFGPSHLSQYMITWSTVAKCNDNLPAYLQIVRAYFLHKVYAPVIIEL